MQETPSFTTLADCADYLSVWFGVRAEQIAAAQVRASSPINTQKDWSAQLQMLADHAESLGHVNEWIPDAEDLLQQAEALVTEELLTAKPDITPTMLKTLTKGKVHTFTRTARMLDRLSATLTHRMEALRSIVSAGKEMYRQESYSPNINSRTQHDPRR